MSEDHDLLIRLETKMDMVISALKKGEDTFKNHEERIQEEERWTARFKTGIGLIAFIVTIMATLLIIFVPK